MTSTPPPYGQQPDGQQPYVPQPFGQRPSSAPQPYTGPPAPSLYGQQPYGGPPQQPFGAPPAPAPGYPPPPPLGAFDQPVGPVPVAAWLIPVAAVLAVIGACTPWFHGAANGNGRTEKFQDSLYSWADGRIGLAPPIVLVVIAIGVIGLLRGRTVRRFSRGSAHPVVSAARISLIVGAGTLVCVLIAWFLVPTQYKFDDGTGNKISWNDALSQLHNRGIDVTFSRGPQIGYFLTIAAGLVAIVAGVLMLLMRDRTPTAPTTFTPPGWSAPPPPAGFPAPAAPYSPPAPPAAPTDGGWSSSTSYSPQPGPNDRPGTDGHDGRPDLTK